MSGVSDVDVCPECGVETLWTYSDFRDVRGHSGMCLNCGYEYWTEDGVMDVDTLEDYRRELGFYDE